MRPTCNYEDFPLRAAWSRGYNAYHKEDVFRPEIPYKLEAYRTAFQEGYDAAVYDQGILDTWDKATNYWAVKRNDGP